MTVGDHNTNAQRRGDALLRSVLLEDHQRELLDVLVQATRSTPADQREMFVGISLAEDARLHVAHPAFARGFGVAEADLEILARGGLIGLKRTAGGCTFFVTPEGFAYHEALRRSAGEGVERVETEVRRLIVSSRFRDMYTEAHRKWVEAEALLWSADSHREFTTIGHLCRESTQMFTDALVKRFRLEEIVDPDKSHTVARLRRVLEAEARSSVGASTEAFLTALVGYWGTVSDLIQRQEHGALRDAEALVWEDARRVVFHTALVMFEIDHCLATS